MPLCCPFVFVLSFCRGFCFLRCLRCPRRLVLSSVSGPGCLGPWRCAVSLPPCISPFFVSAFWRGPAGSLFVGPRPPFPLLFSPFLVFFHWAFGVPPRPCFSFFFFCDSRRSALCVLPLLLCFLPGLWLLSCGCCHPPPPRVCVLRLSSCFCSVSCGFSLLFCSCLLAWGPRPLPPTPPVCALCLVLPVVAVLCCPSVWCVAVLCCQILCCVSWCGVPPCFVVGCSVLCVSLCAALWLQLRAVPCLCSCRPAALFALWFAVGFCCALPCAVVCLVLGCCAAPLCSALCCAVVCCLGVFRSFGAAACCFVPLGAVCRPGVLRFPSLCFVVFPRAVCSVLCVFCCGVVVRAVVRCCVLCCGCPGLSCCAFPVLPALCRAVLRCATPCWCACVVLFVRSALFQAPGTVVPCCVLCCCLWCAVARCWVWQSTVVFWWRVTVSVSLSGRFACFPVVGLVCCGALLPCVLFCGVVLSCGAVLSCSAVFLRCCLCLVFFSL